MLLHVSLTCNLEDDPHYLTAESEDEDNSDSETWQSKLVHALAIKDCAPENDEDSTDESRFKQTT